MPLFATQEQYQGILNNGELIVDCKGQSPIRLILPPQTPEFNLQSPSEMRERLMGFAKEYEALCRKYGLQIDSCGCCNSPWISSLEERGFAHLGNDVDFENIVEQVTQYCEKKNI